MDLEKLYASFVKEKRFLSNVSQKTVDWYWQSWKAFTRSVQTDEINKQVLMDFMVALRESGLSATSTNTYARAINTFLTWLYENEHLKENLKIKRMKEEKKVYHAYSEAHIQAFLHWKPKGWYEWRLYALMATLLDTGGRIAKELLPLKRECVDFDNMFILLAGKGNKERIVPISLELRKILYKWLDMNEHDYVFATKNGTKMLYRNTLRDFGLLCDKLGIKGVKTSFHTFRRTFALNYVKSGGDLFYLQKALGHSSIATTKLYVELLPEDLKQLHKKTSILSRTK
jgi:integrase/recombinase XerD